MQNVFSSSGGLRNRRLFPKKEPWNLPASLGVRQGFVADVERPLPEGVAPQRKSRRIPAGLRLLVGEEWLRVEGDLSAGGALVLYPEPLAGEAIPMIIQLREGAAWTVAGEVLRCERRGRQYAHHLRFVSPEDVAGLDEAIARALDAGQARLDTI